MLFLKLGHHEPVLGDKKHHSLGSLCDHSHRRLCMELDEV